MNGCIVRLLINVKKRKKKKTEKTILLNLLPNIVSYKDVKMKQICTFEPKIFIHSFIQIESNFCQ